MKEPQKASQDFWLDLGPAGAWADMDCQADWDGDASPDGRRRDFTGAQDATVYEPGAAEKQPSHTGQMPDVSADNVPAEIPPQLPETWPGL